MKKSVSVGMIVLLLIVFCGKKKEVIINYFNQTPPGDIPQRFAPDIVSTANHEHSRLEFSPDGKEVFWSVINLPMAKGGEKIWHSRYENGEWIKPEMAPFSKNFREGSPAFTPDGTRLFYRAMSSDEENKSENQMKNPMIYCSVEKNGNTWSQPTRVEDFIQLNRYTMSFQFSQNGNLYFDHGGPNAEKGAWEWAIYCSRFQKGTYLAPEKLGAGINDTGASWTPYIAPDESYLIFSSHGREDSFGAGDLYISFRKKDGSLSIPINMGDKINTPSQERFPSISPDGRYLFFARNTEENYSDIFWVDAGIIELLRINKLKDKK